MEKEAREDLIKRNKIIKTLIYTLIALFLINIFLINRSHKQSNYIESHHHYIASQSIIHVEYAKILLTRALVIEDPLERAIILDRSGGHLLVARGYIQNFSPYFHFKDKLRQGRSARSFNSIGIEGFFNAYEGKLTDWALAYRNNDEENIPTDEELFVMQRDIVNIKNHLSKDVHKLDGYQLHDLFVQMVKEAKTSDLYFGFTLERFY